MRRLCTVLLILAVMSSALYADDLWYESAGLASIDGTLGYIENPALIKERANSSDFFTFGLNFSDSIVPGGGMLPFMISPQNNMFLSFAGNSMAISLTTSNVMMNRNPQGSFMSFQSENMFEINAGWAFRLWRFSFGFGLNGGSSTRRDSVRIYPNSFASDYLIEMLFNHYYPVPDSEYIDGTVSILYRTHRFGLSFMFDHMISAIFDDEGNFGFNMDSFTSGLNFGFSINSDRYADDYSLNLLYFTLSADALRVGDEDGREFRIGGSMKFQFLPEMDMSLYGGVIMRGHVISTWRSDLVATLGLSFRYEGMRFNIASSLPAGLSMDPGLYPARYVLSFSYSN